MLRILLASLLFVHGVIHLIGFAKAFHYGSITQLTKEISRTAGAFWLASAAIFCVSAVLCLLRKEAWWPIATAGVIISQMLIFSVWSDAKFGTIANGIVLAICLASFGSWQFKQAFRRDIKETMGGSSIHNKELLTEKDIQHLPLVVQKYLRYVGVLNQPKVYNYRVRFNGEMREKGKDWFSFTSEQYNFTELPTRLFFMKAKMKGITVPGYHAYKNGRATMQIKLFGLLAVVSEKEGVLDQAETVTILNDMCLFAPASLISPAIRWESVDMLTAKAIFTVKEMSISALLHFNKDGQLINFVSEDRYVIAEKKRYRFSTPISQYRNFHGYMLPGYGEAVWHYPDGEFAYGRFNTADVQYNAE